MEAMTIFYTKENEDQYTGFLKEHPVVVGQGNSVEELSTDIKQNYKFYLECMIRDIDNLEFVSIEY